MHPQLAQIGKAAGPTELWRVVRGYYLGLGFRGLAYFVASRNSPDGTHGFNIIHRGFARTVSEIYIDEGLGDQDPVPTMALRRGKPVRWMEAWGSIKPDSEQAIYLERTRAAGMGDGYTFPTYGPGGRNGCIAVGRVANARLLEEAPVDEMHLIAQSAHMRLCQLLPERPALSKPLSARELEILGWVARGKSNSVIADILELSGATVDTYLRRIYDKLNVSDRTSAAVRGVGMGLITA